MKRPKPNSKDNGRNSNMIELGRRYYERGEGNTSGNSGRGYNSLGGGDRVSGDGDGYSRTDRSNDFRSDRSADYRSGRSFDSRDARSFDSFRSDIGNRTDLVMNSASNRRAGTADNNRRIGTAHINHLRTDAGSFDHLRNNNRNFVSGRSDRRSADFRTDTGRNDRRSANFRTNNDDLTGVNARSAGSTGIDFGRNENDSRRIYSDHLRSDTKKSDFSASSGSTVTEKSVLFGGNGGKDSITTDEGGRSVIPGGHIAKSISFNDEGTASVADVNGSTTFGADGTVEVSNAISREGNKTDQNVIPNDTALKDESDVNINYLNNNYIAKATNAANKDSAKFSADASIGSRKKGGEDYGSRINTSCTVNSTEAETFSNLLSEITNNLINAPSERNEFAVRGPNNAFAMGQSTTINSNRIASKGFAHYGGNTNVDVHQSKKPKIDKNLSSIYITNLSLKVNDAWLKNEFNVPGVLSTEVLDKKLCHGVVDFESKKAAQNALTKLKGKIIDGRRIKMKLTNTKPKKALGISYSDTLNADHRSNVNSENTTDLPSNKRMRPSEDDINFEKATDEIDDIPLSRVNNRKHASPPLGKLIERCEVGNTQNGIDNARKLKSRFTEAEMDDIFFMANNTLEMVDHHTIIDQNKSNLLGIPIDADTFYADGDFNNEADEIPSVTVSTENFTSNSVGFHGNDDSDVDITKKATKTYDALSKVVHLILNDAIDEFISFQPRNGLLNANPLNLIKKEVESQYQKLENSINELHKLANTLTSENLDMKNQISSNNDGMNSLIESHKDLSSRINSACNEFMEIKKSNNFLRKKEEDLQNQLRELERLVKDSEVSYETEKENFSNGQSTIIRGDPKESHDTSNLNITLSNSYSEAEDDGDFSHQSEANDDNDENDDSDENVGSDESVDSDIDEKMSRALLDSEPQSRFPSALYKEWHSGTPSMGAIITKLKAGGKSLQTLGKSACERWNLKQHIVDFIELFSKTWYYQLTDEERSKIPFNEKVIDHEFSLELDKYLRTNQENSYNLIYRIRAAKAKDKLDKSANDDNIAKRKELFDSIMLTMNENKTAKNQF